MPQRALYVCSARDPRPRWYHRLRVSTRSLIILVLLIGGSIGWLTRSARMQRQAVIAIQRAGGFVVYDSGLTENRSSIARGPWAPYWLVDHLGIDYFAHVSRVRFLMDCPEDGLVPLASLTRPISLQIHTRRSRTLRCRISKA